MEKYARQALSEGAKSDTELHVSEDSELYRVLNVHYNRNNHIEVGYTVSVMSNGLGYCVSLCHLAMVLICLFLGSFTNIFYTHTLSTYPLSLSLSLSHAHTHTHTQICFLSPSFIQNPTFILLSD